LEAVFVEREEVVVLAVLDAFDAWTAEVGERGEAVDGCAELAVGGGESGGWVVSLSVS
jgi:hypothetical protein